MLGVEIYGESNWAKIMKQFGNEIGERGPSGYRKKVKSLKLRKSSEAVVAANETTKRGQCHR